jgi:hypothetical protein
MPYVQRKPTCGFPPFNPETRRTADPGLTVESLRFEDPLILHTHTLWQEASLTQAGRNAVLRQVPIKGTDTFTFEGAFTEGWLVRNPSVQAPFELAAKFKASPDKPFAIVLKLGEHYLHGRLVSATPERQRMEHTDRLLVVMRDLVISVRGADPDRAFSHLADVLAGTRRAPRRRVRPLPEGDAEALGWLQAEPPRSPEASHIQE